LLTSRSGCRRTLRRSGGCRRGSSALLSGCRPIQQGCRSHGHTARAEDCPTPDGPSVTVHESFLRTRITTNRRISLLLRPADDISDFRIQSLQLMRLNDITYR
jgi:hypothetical protein